MPNLHLLTQTFSQARHASGTDQFNGLGPPLTSRRSLGRFVDLLLTWAAGNMIPHVISDAGYWNDWDIWLRRQDLNL
jgi:hypothetical protein